MEARRIFDAIIVGAGPGGATTAYYTTRDACGGRQPSVALLDKARFPRDKICGDAWCAPALDILEEMGVLQALESEGLVRNTRRGGFVSPSGQSFVNTDQGTGASDTRVYAIKRSICDERIARAAVGAGAELFEEAEVVDAKLDDDDIWTVSCRDKRVFRGRVLVAADGATTPLARRLGLVTDPPTTFAGRQYVKGGTHNFAADGVLLYPKYILPGYVALFRHYNDDIDLGSYVIPGGEVSPKELVRVHEERILHDPFIQAVLGPHAEFLETFRVAPLRLGGIKRSYARQLLIVGDAAGQTDPLTGEGIHTAMIAARHAATTIGEMLAQHDFSEKACSRYHERWMATFGREFPASATAARLTCRMPVLMDSANVVAQRRGDAFMQEFGAAMTGVKPKTTFLKPSVAGPLAFELARQLLRRRVDYEKVYPLGVSADAGRPTAFRNACLRTAGVG